MKVNREFLTTINKTPMKGRKILWIVIHYTGVWTDKAINNVKYFQSGYRGASAHVFVDEDGAWMSVPYEDAAWSVGRNYGHSNLFGECTNGNSISIEMSSRNGVIQPKTIDNTVELTKELMQTYGIDTDHVVRHWDVCSKNCPGWYGWNPSTGSEQLWFDFKSRLQTKKEEPADNYDLIFDAAYYREHHPDIAAQGWDDLGCFFHFFGCGMDEGRRASFWFDPVLYRSAYGDLNAAFGDNWRSYYEHYMRYGHREGRFPIDLSSVYEFKWYRAHHADLGKAFGDDEASYLTHFILYGMKEGRQASEAFNPVAYRGRYPDLDDAFGDDWRRYYRHWIECGTSEGRNGA